jgi:cysteine desulfurase
MTTLYLDHAATTPVDPLVLEAMKPYFTDVFGNASSIHGTGRAAKSALETARASIARVVGAQPAEIVFTSGGTESDNAAIVGVLQAASDGKRHGIVTSAAEHHAVLSVSEHQEQMGHPVHVLPVDRHGVVERDALEAALSRNPVLVSLMYANNEVGAIAPLQEIAAQVHAAGALLHTDAVQCLGKMPVDVNALGVDLMTLTAHKVYGPKGIGLLYIRNGTAWNPLLQGGGQERGRRPGTENVALAVGFARAVELAAGRVDEESKRLSMMRDALERRLLEEFPALVLNSTCVPHLPNILNVSFDSKQMPMQGELLIVNLDLAGIAASSGSACTSGSVQPSHVLTAMGRDAATAVASVRFSFGRMNEPENVENVVSALKTAVTRVKANKQ